MRVLGPLLLTLYVVRRVRNSQTASTAAPCGPFRRGQHSPSPWKPWTTLAGCPPFPPSGRVAHRSTAWGGTPPQTPPRCAALRGLFEISPEARKPSGPAALRAALALPHWSADGWGEPRRPFRPCGGRASPPQGGRGNLPPSWSRPRRRAERRGESEREALRPLFCPPAGGLMLMPGL